MAELRGPSDAGPLRALNPLETRRLGAAEVERGQGGRKPSEVRNRGGAVSYRRRGATTIPEMRGSRTGAEGSKSFTELRRCSCAGCSGVERYRMA